MSYIIVGRKKLQSTPSVGRATHPGPAMTNSFSISIHALRGEGDTWKLFQYFMRHIFLSTPSVGRATKVQQLYRLRYNISIHALRGEGDNFFVHFPGGPAVISIHALRGEGDPGTPGRPASPEYFYPRPPWGGRHHRQQHCQHHQHFYPRPPWGGRRGEGASPPLCLYFYPRPPWGGRPESANTTIPGVNFYPRPPWGGRRKLRAAARRAKEFLSTPSVGRATLLQLGIRPKVEISIHALRGEGDAQHCSPCTAAMDFYPRPPWGGRRSRWRPGHRRANFYPRPPWGGRPAVWVSTIATL